MMRAALLLILVLGLIAVRAQEAAQQANQDAKAYCLRYATMTAESPSQRRSFRRRLELCRWTTPIG